ncbi:MAG: hypothetical protein NTW26_04875 [bacterium]|nr:hypothetical protein [bacterium]
MMREKPFAPVALVLLTAMCAVAADPDVTGGLEPFLAKFPDAAEIYFQTMTEEGVGFYTITTPSGEMSSTGIPGRGMDGVASAGLLVHEGPGPDGIEDIFFERAGEEPVSFGGPLRDLNPSVSAGGRVVFATETEPDRFDLALWDAGAGMRRLELGCGDETEPAILCATADGPTVVVFQSRQGEAFQLYYAVIGPGDEIVRVERLLDFPGRALNPDLLDPRPDRAPADGDTFQLAFHALGDDDQRDLYCGEVTFHGDLADPEEIRLTAGEPERLTESPADDKYPELYRDSGGTLWCFFASFRDGDYDLYALDLDTRELYQLTDLPGTQTAPYVRALEP